MWKTQKSLMPLDFFGYVDLGNLLSVIGVKRWNSVLMMWRTLRLGFFLIPNGTLWHVFHFSTRVFHKEKSIFFDFCHFLRSFPLLGFKRLSTAILSYAAWRFWFFSTPVNGLLIGFLHHFSTGVENYVENLCFGVERHFCNRKRFFFGKLHR